MAGDIQPEQKSLDLGDPESPVNVVYATAKVKLEATVRARLQEAERQNLNILVELPRVTKMFVAFVFEWQMTRSKQAPPFRGLVALTDWVPSSATRKRQRKLLADEAAEILEFREQGRFWLARWRTMWAWWHWARYLVSAPIGAAVKALLKSASG